MYQIVWIVIQKQFVQNVQVAKILSNKFWLCLRFFKYGDLNTITQCICGAKQRIFECLFCKCPQAINGGNLKQSSRIICFSCKNGFYIVNCPGCKNMKILNNANEKNYCENCNSHFQIDDCKICQEDAFSRDLVEPFIFRCSNNHQYQRLICLHCKKPNKLNITNNKSYLCQHCNTKMKQISCLCGQKQIMRRAENNQLQRFNCLGCRLDYLILKCNTQDCLGELLKLDRPQMRPSEFGPFIEIVNSICFQCKIEQFIPSCLRCNMLQEPFSLQMNKPTRCKGCQQEFIDSKYRECVVCVSHLADSILMPCKHVCVCNSCLQGLTFCPICRRDIKDRFKIFLN
ncbi:unnamed protein product (macronuclear) [Paramecium tetraurelia]|uniref:RING-type domain-containing protein n=1 Tax=Paramecium tetraurelia TaxID=5888 RepID=A0C829_PARTE|nr:uncharacterized protein GSPATT00036077001 [Paramecium tetraurelia]CAK66946.1 unnamed protein product [Paramecium tetraurelia]|eukprot:XP_001434343.1 hypothetical protein (macronuclear) [Paramecium tetraurelia strain d4-2]